MEHLVIPDCQITPDSPINHLPSAMNYAIDRKPDTIICLGDFWDMHSLSFYDKGTKRGEGANYQADIDAGLEAMELMMSPLKAYNDKRKKQKMKAYKPRMVFTIGNHEERIVRHTNANPELFGKLSYDDLMLSQHGWETYDFLEPVDIDGVLYCHYFVNTSSLKKNVLGGTIDNKLKAVGQSFTMGHQQILQTGLRYLNNGTIQRGVVAGAFYQQDFDYMGYQGNHHWRGCLYKHEVKAGNYCLMELSLEYLMKEWL